MTKTHRRKLKNIIAEIIANLLIMIAILIKCLIPATILILIIVSAHITYEQFRQAIIVISFAISRKCVRYEERAWKPCERREKERKV